MRHAQPTQPNWTRRSVVTGLLCLGAAACVPKPKSAAFAPTNDQVRAQLLVAAAMEQVGVTTIYDGAYRALGFPFGDIESERGVCTDVVVRAYRRALGIDLQQQVNADMHQAFYDYPNLEKWDLTRPDPNIDHRRVLNLMVFFQRMGASLPLTRDPAVFLPGDLVTQRLTPTNNHIALVADGRSADGRRPLIVHNICCGVKVEDRLFEFPITGHYRYLPPPASMRAIDPMLMAQAKQELARKHADQNGRLEAIAAVNVPSSR